MYDSIQTAPPAPLPRMWPIMHLMRGVWLQLVRRNEIYIVAILLGLYVVGALVLRIVGIESPQTARFIAGLGFQLGAALAALLVIAMGARQVPIELEARTVHPILAKPITRAQFLAGKALPTFLLGVCALVLFAIATLAITPRLPYQLTVVLFQALALGTAALAMLTAMIFWLSLWLPMGVAMLIGGALYFGGATLGNILIQATGTAKPMMLFSGLIPDFSLLDLFTRYVDGGAALRAIAFGGLMIYAALWTTIFSWLAIRRFRRMEL